MESSKDSSAQSPSHSSPPPSSPASSPPPPPPPLHDFLPVAAEPQPADTVQEAEGPSQSPCLQLSELQRRHLGFFWHCQRLGMLRPAGCLRQFHRRYEFPLARIKRVMKLDGDVKLVSSETLVIFSKACEMLISELTIRSWLHAATISNSQSLNRSDIAHSVLHARELEFLTDHAVDEDHDS